MLEIQLQDRPGQARSRSRPTSGWDETLQASGSKAAHEQPQVTSEKKKSDGISKTKTTNQRDSGFSSPVCLHKRVGPCWVRSVIMPSLRPNRQLSNQVRRGRPFILMTTPGWLLSSGVEGLTGPLQGGLATGTDRFSTKRRGPRYITKILPIWKEGWRRAGCLTA